MSEAAIALDARSFIQEHGFGQRTVRALRAALEAARPGPLQLFWEAGDDGGLPPQQIKSITTGLFFLFACANLTDDLVDGDCDYLDERQGPVIQFILRSLGHEQLLSRTPVPTEVQARASRDLALATSFAITELGIKRWDSSSWMEVARGIAGMQYQAYLRCLWFQPPLNEVAEELGMKLGILGHLYHDLLHRDPRFLGMDTSCQQVVFSRAEQLERELLDEATRRGLRSVTLALEQMDWRTLHGQR